MFAQTVLTGAPVHLARRDDMSLRIQFASITELRRWLAVTGLDTPDLLTSEHEWTGEDGRQVHTMHAFPEDWHGWKAYVSATEYTDAPLLAPDLRARLTAITPTTTPDGDNGAPAQTGSDLADHPGGGR